MNIKNFVEEWVETGNCFDTKKYLSFYCKDAILDDPSVGSTFTGHQGIEAYFTNYFIDYQTQTTLMKLDIQDSEHAHLKVAFCGNFPEGNISGTFDFTFKNGKIAFVKADL